MPDGPAPQTAGAELERLRAEVAIHQRFRDLTIAFSRAVASARGLAGGLGGLTVDTNALLGARRTSVWLHQRRSHDLALVACSDASTVTLAGVVRTDDRDAPAAQGLRLDRPHVVQADGGEPLLLAPLRGWRRALGTLVVEGPFSAGLDSSQLADIGHELARQLSAAIENIQLLDEILRQRRLLEDTFDSLVDLVVVTDSAWRIIQMNESFTARTGRSRRDLLERPLSDFVGGEMAAWAADPGRPTGTGLEAARTHRFEDPRLNGLFDVTMTSFAPEGGAPAGHVLVARDVTHQTRLEQERQALGERLAQSEKLAALGQFVAGIAHEMNNPLQGVLGHLELMIETSEAARPLRRDLRRIYQDAHRAARIVRNLLVFTGSRRMVRRRLKLSRLISRVLASRAVALERAGIQVIREEPGTLPHVTGDPLLLHQAFLNIIINAEHAIRSISRAGCLEVRSWHDTQNHHVVTTIRDTGPGIPTDALPRVFDPFFTTKDVGQGTGLGLAITYGIVSEHGGRIHASNAADGGAILTVALPAS